MKPIEPVLPSHPELFAPHIGAGHKNYLPLPAILFHGGAVITRWKFSWRERVKLFLHGSIYVSVLTSGKTLQPIRFEVDEPELTEDDLNLLMKKEDFSAEPNT